MSPKQNRIEINLNPNELPNAECKTKDCHSIFFETVIIKKIVSAFHPQNPTGKELYLDKAVTICRKCGAIFE